MEYKIILNNEDNVLEHHGVKGQKWGVRRYQNPDGSLTSAGEKRYGKREKLRNKLANKALRNENRMLTDMKNAKKDLRDLKKNGAKSEVYKNHMKKVEEQRKKEYEDSHSFTDENGNRYTMKYSKNLFNVLDDYLSQDKVIQDLISEKSDSAKRYKENADKWRKTHESLMNTEVTAFTSRSSLLKQYLLTK